MLQASGSRAPKENGEGLSVRPVREGCLRSFYSINRKVSPETKKKKKNAVLGQSKDPREPIFNLC